MTVDGLLKNGFGAVATPETDREITGVYIGDLLSWVMGRAQSGDAWVTIMSNANIVAGACIIAAEGVEIPADVRKTAEEKGVNILSFLGSAYDAAITLHSLL